jgi:hypothetical protein
MSKHPGTERSYPEEPADRLGEVAEILAAGLIRLEARKSSPKRTKFGESSLHFTPDQSGDAPSYSTEVPNG